MPRIVYGNATFEPVSSRSWYERDFEAMVLARAAQIFPRWICVPFYMSVEGPDGTVRKPDLALIDTHYREWWVVEIELHHHDLYAHVLPQIEVFVSGRYEAAHAGWLASKHPTLNRDRLAEMMLGVPPQVLVVVDSLSTDWAGPLAAAGAKLAIAEPFRNVADEHLLRINGMQPEPLGETLTRCSRHLRRLWRVESPAALPAELPDGGYSIEYEDVAVVWSVVRAQDMVFLKPVRGDVLSGLSVVDLTLRDDGTLEFLKPKTRRK